MPANKNALIRYKTIDRCLRNPYRRWTVADLVRACSDALRESEGIYRSLSERTIQLDIRAMRSAALYNAPIEVYDVKYYRYSDPDFSITSAPLAANDYKVLHEVVELLRQFEDFDHFGEMSESIRRLQDKLAINVPGRTPIVHFDSVPGLKGIDKLGPLYDMVARRQSLHIVYKPFNAAEPHNYVICPHLLKEFNNRWFLFGTEQKKGLLYNLPLDRIVSFEPADVPYFDNPHFDPLHFFDDVIGVSKNVNDRPVNIKVWVAAQRAQYVVTKPIHSSQQLLEQNPDGSCVFSLSVVVNRELFASLLSFGPDLRPIAPAFVVNQYASLVSGMKSQL